MDNKTIDKLEEEYTCGKCIYLACALAQQHSLSISAFLFAEDEKGNQISDLTDYKHFSEIPDNLHDYLIIDHVYATDGKDFYDFYGKTNTPECIAEPNSNLIHGISVEDIQFITSLSFNELKSRIDEAKQDMDNYFSDKFNNINTNRHSRRNRP